MFWSTDCWFEWKNDYFITLLINVFSDLWQFQCFKVMSQTWDQLFTLYFSSLLDHLQKNADNYTLFPVLVQMFPCSITPDLNDRVTQASDGWAIESGVLEQVNI